MVEVRVVETAAAREMEARLAATGVVARVPVTAAEAMEAAERVEAAKGRCLVERGAGKVAAARATARAAAARMASRRRHPEAGCELSAARAAVVPPRGTLSLSLCLRQTRPSQPLMFPRRRQHTCTGYELACVASSAVGQQEPRWPVAGSRISPQAPSVEEGWAAEAGVLG